MYNGIYNEAVNKLYESIVWTHKIQRTYLESLETRRKVFSILEIIFTSLSSVATAVFAIFGNSVGTIIASVFTLCSVIFASILEKVETKTDIDLFRKSSSSLWLMRCRIEQLSLEIKGGLLSDGEVHHSVEMFQSAFESITSNLPTVPNRVVNAASYKIKERKDEEVELKLL